MIISDSLIPIGLGILFISLTGIGDHLAFKQAMEAQPYFLPHLIRIGGLLMVAKGIHEIYDDRKQGFVIFRLRHKHSVH